MPVLEHPLYLPDLAPCYFFIFCKLKISLREAYFESFEDIQGNVRTVLKGLSENGFQAWQNCWSGYIKPENKYFKGDPPSLKVKENIFFRISSLFIRHLVCS
jgi:hypothetical protein